MLSAETSESESSEEEDEDVDAEDCAAGEGFLVVTVFLTVIFVSSPDEESEESSEEEEEAKRRFRFLLRFRGTVGFAGGIMVRGRPGQRDVDELRYTRNGKDQRGKVTCVAIHSAQKLLWVSDI